MPKRSLIRNVSKALAVLTAAVIVGACGGSPQARSITLTFIRHAESEANASGIIDTSVPGAGLSAEGKEQAQQVAHRAGRKDYDGVYASTMARAQQTAAPLAAELGKQVEVLQGVQEINAGWFNGKPVAQEASTYLLAPADWLKGDMQDSIPGSVSGKEFNERFTAAIQKVYNSGQHNPVVFSHKFDDRVLDADEHQERQGHAADQPPAAQHRARGDHRQPDDRLDAGGVGRHPRLPQLSGGDSGTNHG